VSTSTYDFVIKRGNLLPVITATLQDANSNAMDLTGATAKFIMRQVGATLPKVNATAVIDPDQVNNKGKISYTWQTADTDTPGIYEAEWEVTFTGSKPQSFPNDDYLVLRVLDDLD